MIYTDLYEKLSKGDKKGIVETFSMHNLSLLRKRGMPFTQHANYVNNAFLDASNFPIQNLGFHVGRAFQSNLNPREINGFTPAGVNFSMSLGDPVHYLEDFLNEMVYFVDITSLRNSRVQTDYRSSVICKDYLNEIPEENKEERRKWLLEWEKKYTAPYNPAKAHDYIKRGEVYLLVGSPIKVSIENQTL
jgi:hypothetical protein